MKVIEIKKDDTEKLKNFVDAIVDGKTRPAIYIGLDEDNEPVMHTTDLSWHELSYIKLAFDAQITRAWLGIE